MFIAALLSTSWVMPFVGLFAESVPGAANKVLPEFSKMWVLAAILLAMLAIYITPPRKD